VVPCTGNAPRKADTPAAGARRSALQARTALTSWCPSRRLWSGARPRMRSSHATSARPPPRCCCACTAWARRETPARTPAAACTFRPRWCGACGGRSAAHRAVHRPRPCAAAVALTALSAVPQVTQLLKPGGSAALAAVAGLLNAAVGRPGTH